MSDYDNDGNIFTGYEDELREHREYQKHYYSGGGSSSGEPQGCGCLSTMVVLVALATILWVIEQLLGW